MGGYSGDKGPFATLKACQDWANTYITTTECKCANAATPAASNGFQLKSTGSQTGDLVNDAAQLWILQNIKNPYTMTFAQNFTQSFLTSYIANQQQREAVEAAIQQQQEQQAEQARAAEKARIDAIFARLNSELKLSGINSQLGLKTSSDVAQLQMKFSTSSPGGGLQLKTCDDSGSGYGIHGLSGVYTGGEAPAPPANDSAGGLKLKLGDAPPSDSATPAPSGACAEGGIGIPGLPGIYLNNIQPAQAAQVAAAAITMDGPERGIVEDAALAAAQKNPDLTAPSDDPFVQDYQQQAQEYEQALKDRQAALDKAAQAKGQLQAQQTALAYAGQMMQSGNATDAQMQTVAQMQALNGPQEALSAEASAQFGDIENTTVVKRNDTTFALADLAPPGAIEGGTAATSSTGSSLPVISLGSKPQIIATIPRTGRIPQPPPQLPAPKVVESLQSCMAQWAPAGGALPSYDELKKKLEGTMTAMERLAKSRENLSEEDKDFNDMLDDARKDLATDATDKLFDGVLGMTKSTIGIVRGGLTEAVEENVTSAEKLHQLIEAAGGDKAESVEAAKDLMKYNKFLQERAEDLEHFKGIVEKERTGRDYASFLAGNTCSTKWVPSFHIECVQVKSKDDLVKALKMTGPGQLELSTSPSGWTSNAELAKMVLEGASKYTPLALKNFRPLLKEYAPQLKPALFLAEHGTLIGEAWDWGSMASDAIYYGAVLMYRRDLNKQFAQDRQQDLAARAELGARLNRLEGQAACYEKFGAGQSENALR